MVCYSSKRKLEPTVLRWIKNQMPIFVIPSLVLEETKILKEK